MENNKKIIVGKKYLIKDFEGKNIKYVIGGYVPQLEDFFGEIVTVDYLMFDESGCLVEENGYCWDVRFLNEIESKTY